MDSEISNDLIIRGRALSDQEQSFKSDLVAKKKALLVLDLDNTILHSLELSRIDEELFLEQIEDYLIIPT